jgi:hypothetical protein
MFDRLLHDNRSSESPEGPHLSSDAGMVERWPMKRISTPPYQAGDALLLPRNSRSTIVVELNNPRDDD